VEGAGPAPVRYTQSGDVNLAYQVVGSGPIDLVFVMGWVSHLEYFWKEPGFARFLRQLASFSRLILFDKRGTGLSDRVPLNALPTLEQRMDDLRAVMDAAGSRQAVLVGVSEGGPLAALFAATYPERTRALVMIGTYARRTRSRSYPWGRTEEEQQAFLQEIHAGWGGPVGIESRAPSRAQDPAFRDWWAAYLRMGASPGAAVAITRMNSEIDVRNVLPLIRVPALVIHRTGDQVLTVEEGRFVASLIPGARMVELPGEDHLPFVGTQDDILNEISDFVAEVKDHDGDTRVLATVMLIAAGEVTSALRLEIGRMRGELFECRGNLAALFDGPARAIRCATAIVEMARPGSPAAAAGLHTGECERLGKFQFRGFALEVAASVLSKAGPGEVLVSGTVRDLVAGSGIQLERLAGLPVSTPYGLWPLYRVAAAMDHIALDGRAVG
jgi:pimeloyl-ACP methyl ester carboxylesterase